MEDWYWWSWLGYKLNCIYLLNVVREYWLKFVAARTNLGDERNYKIEKKLNFNINNSKNGPYINSAAYIEQILKMIEMGNQGQNCNSIWIAWKMGHIRMMTLECRNIGF